MEEGLSRQILSMGYVMTIGYYTLFNVKSQVIQLATILLAFCLNLIIIYLLFSS